MGESQTIDAVHLRLPIKPEYLSVLRSTVGVIAGNLDFRYDEVIQLRVAVSEIFDLAIEHRKRQPYAQAFNELTIEFAPQVDGLRIVITHPQQIAGGLLAQGGDETRALLDSLMDKVEVSEETSAVCMVKLKSVA